MNQAQPYDSGSVGRLVGPSVLGDPNAASAKIETQMESLIGRLDALCKHAMMNLDRMQRFSTRMHGVHSINNVPQTTASRGETPKAEPSGAYSRAIVALDLIESALNGQMAQCDELDRLA